jgi:hypothetical protein
MKSLMDPSSTVVDKDGICVRRYVVGVVFLRAAKREYSALVVGGEKSSGCTGVADKAVAERLDARKAGIVQDDCELVLLHSRAAVPGVSEHGRVRCPRGIYEEWSPRRGACRLKVLVIASFGRIEEVIGRGFKASEVAEHGSYFTSVWLRAPYLP